jgi:hypothetical protein
MPGSLKGFLLVAGAVAVLAGSVLPADAHKKQKASSSPAPVMPAASTGTGPLGYYLMSGNQIVSPAYENLGACYKDLTKVKQRMVPGSDTLVCVYRRP